MADQPRPGAGAGACGCLAALLAVPALGVPFLVAMGLEVCLPGNACRRDDEAILYGGAALVLAFAALLGFSARALAGWALARRAGRPAGPPPLWAAVAGAAGLMLLFWVGWKMWPILGP
jgi:hypothetical protein